MPRGVLSGLNELSSPSRRPSPRTETSMRSGWSSTVARLISPKMASCVPSGVRPGRKGKDAMPEADSRDDKNFHEDIPPPDAGFFLKGAGAYDWGMKNRLARIFRADTARTVML